MQFKIDRVAHLEPDLPSVTLLYGSVAVAGPSSVEFSFSCSFLRLLGRFLPFFFDLWADSASNADVGLDCDICSTLCKAGWCHKKHWLTLHCAFLGQVGIICPDRKQTKQSPSFLTSIHRSDTLSFRNSPHSPGLCNLLQKTHVTVENLVSVGFACDTSELLFSKFSSTCLLLGVHCNFPPSGFCAPAWLDVPDDGKATRLASRATSVSHPAKSRTVGCG